MIGPLSYDGIFGDVTTFWVFTCVKIKLILNATSNPILNQNLLTLSERSVCVKISRKEGFQNLVTNNILTV